MIATASGQRAAPLNHRLESRDQTCAQPEGKAAPRTQAACPRACRPRGVRAAGSRPAPPFAGETGGRVAGAESGAGVGGDSIIPRFTAKERRNPRRV
jgi:hypothetical protein